MLLTKDHTMSSFIYHQEKPLPCSRMHAQTPLCGRFDAHTNNERGNYIAFFKFRFVIKKLYEILISVIISTLTHRPGTF